MVKKSNKKRGEMFYKWIKAVLTNDENSSDKEIENYFKREGKMTKKEAKCYIRQRDKALLNPLKFKLKKCQK